MFGWLRRPSPSAALYLSHRLDDNALAGWRHLRETCDSRTIKPFFVYDNARNDFNGHPDIPDEQVFLFSYDALHRRWPMPIWAADRPFDQGNLIFLSLEFFKRFPHFDNYWKLEYDVYLDGEWRSLFADFDKPADLITTTLVRPEVRPDWVWWQTLAYPSNLQRPVRPLRAFMPILRLSKRACAVLERAYADGWAGHDEVSVPTILNHHGMRLVDLGHGDFSRGTTGRTWYTNTPSREGLGPGSFVCPPKVAETHEQEGLLYHPVKDRKLFSVRLEARPAAL